MIAVSPLSATAWPNSQPSPGARAVSLNSCRYARARSDPLIVCLESQTEHVVAHTQRAVRTAAHRCGPDELHLLRHHPDIGLVAPIVAEAVEPKSVVEAAEQCDILLQVYVGPTTATPAGLKIRLIDHSPTSLRPR